MNKTCRPNFRRRPRSDQPWPAYLYAKEWDKYDAMVWTDYEEQTDCGVIGEEYYYQRRLRYKIDSRLNGAEITRLMGAVKLRAIVLFAMTEVEDGKRIMTDEARSIDGEIDRLCAETETEDMEPCSIDGCEYCDYEGR